MLNDDNFKPQKIDTLAGGVTFSGINDTDPAVVPDHREGGILKRKFGEFKLLYGTCIQRFTASGQGEDDCFPNSAQGRTFMMLIVSRLFIPFQVR